MSSAATKLLANTLKNVLMDPVEGFTVELTDESNLFEWGVYIEGPKDTLYEGGVFQMNMKFPFDFPMSPPELRFTSDFWHPNVYRDTGLVCISILHPPGEDEMSGESASERWLPTQTVTTILLSVISLLNAPNFSSPANVDASVEWRNDPIAYKKKCQRLIEKANREKPSHIVIPHPDTNKEEREIQIEKMKAANKPVEVEDDFMNEVAEESEDGTGSDDNGSQQEDASDGEGSGSESKEESKTNHKPGKTEVGKTTDQGADAKPKAPAQEEASTEKKKKNKKSKKSSSSSVGEDGGSRKNKKKCVIM